MQRKKWQKAIMNEWSETRRARAVRVYEVDELNASLLIELPLHSCLVPYEFLLRMEFFPQKIYSQEHSTVLSTIPQGMFSLSDSEVKKLNLLLPKPMPGLVDSIVQYYSEL